MPVRVPDGVLEDALEVDDDLSIVLGPPLPARGMGAEERLLDDVRRVHLGAEERAEQCLR
jgi:hypothetical protein